MDSVRRVVGSSRNGPGNIAQLAVEIAAEARNFRLRIGVIRVSRAGGAQLSRYLHIFDCQGREWCLRVANHYRPKSAPYAPPHFDLIALDGQSGLAEARRFLLSVATGEAAWTDRSDLGRARRKRRRPNYKRLARGKATA
jgi:hypothetical protein